MSEFKINTKFAEKYEKYRPREELQRLKDKYGDQDEESESGSSESDEESEVELDPKLEREFYRTLSLLKKKDPKIYQEDAQFYTEEASGSASDEQPSTSKKAEKPMYLKDFERKVILERGGKYDDEDASGDEEAARRMEERAASPSYIQEQKELKESFRKFTQDSDEEGSDGEQDSMLLKRRTKSQEEKDKEEADHVDWLKGQAELEGQEEVQDLKYLRDYWNDPQLDEKESFLRDYVLNKGYLEEDEHSIPSYDELVQDDVEDSEDEGESFLQKQEDFERNYNFRFEEPGAQLIKTYPRSIATSVRSKDERRKKKREEVTERKKKEKEQKQEQLKQLKNLKRAEIMDKLKRLQELTGNEQLAFSHVDLEGDFDPQQHDQLMQKFFGDEYYGEEEEEKPQFDDDDEDLEGRWNWDTWTGEADGEDEEGGGEEKGYGQEQGSCAPNCDDPDFIMDADYDPSQQSTSKKKKMKKKEREEKKKKNKEDAPLMGKKRKKSHFAEIITKEKPVFDPEDKSFEQYLDDYYKLDYEDIIDDLPCRFRYRQVVANDFGLTTDEGKTTVIFSLSGQKGEPRGILGADEKELNRWCSLKKTCMFRSERDELCDLKNYQIKAQDTQKKKQVFMSLYSEEDGQAEGKGKMGKKRRDRLKKATTDEEGERKEGDEDGAGTSQGTSAATMDTVEGSAVKALREVGDNEDEEEFLVPKKKRKVDVSTAAASGKAPKPRTGKPHWPRKTPRRPGGRLLSGSFKVKMGGREFSGQRLKAYGLNPKRLHFRELYRQKRKDQEKREKKKNKTE